MELSSVGCVVIVSSWRPQLSGLEYVGLDIEKSDVILRRVFLEWDCYLDVSSNRHKDRRFPLPFPPSYLEDCLTTVPVPWTDIRSCLLSRSFLLYEVLFVNTFPVLPNFLVTLYVEFKCLGLKGFPTSLLELNI